MPSSFTESEKQTAQNQTQKMTLDPASGTEQGLYTQLNNLAGLQAGSLSSQMGLQQALLNPTLARQIMSSADPRTGPGGAADQAIRAKLGNDLMDRFNAGGGTGKGLSPEEFQQYQQAAAQFNQENHSDLRESLQGVSKEDFERQLQYQQQFDQLRTKGISDDLNRQVNPYGLTPQEEQAINKVYDNQRTQAMYQMNQGVQDLAATRGLNRSDAPVANELARQMALMQGNMGAAQAGDLLNRGDQNRMYGLNLNNSLMNQQNTQYQQRNLLNQMTPAANTSLLTPLLQQRMMQGTNNMSGNTIQTSTPSQMDLMMKGIGVIGSMGAGFMTGGVGGAGGMQGLFSGMGGLAGGGSK